MLIPTEISCKVCSNEVFVEELGVCSRVGSLWINSQASSMAKLRIAAETSHKVLSEQIRPDHTHTNKHAHTLTKSNGGLVTAERAKDKNIV